MSVHPAGRPGVACQGSCATRQLQSRCHDVTGRHFESTWTFNLKSRR